MTLPLVLSIQCATRVTPAKSRSQRLTHDHKDRKKVTADTKEDEDEAFSKEDNRRCVRMDLGDFPENHEVTLRCCRVALILSLHLPCPASRYRYVLWVA